MHGVGDGRFFDRFARLYDWLMPAADRRSLAAALSRADGDVDRLLDLGGGTGRATIAVDAPERMVVDISRPMLQRARTRTTAGPGRPSDPPGPLATLQGDAGRLPVGDDAVDAAIVVDAFHHMPAQPAVVSEVQRVLRPGGVFVVREFDPSHPLGWVLARGEHAIGMESTFHPPADLAEMLADEGFSVEVLDSGFEYTLVGTNR
ncbi:methyltransferase domain-containing protein [Halonotius terrestris]|uniref:Methyltransferase domain-containing protein n=1 Tax=Halonotius terrestris TaxID=2487750 RepID=A0A8J8TCR1_9EURY|nr:class I SAM-dependent methyltransferase [Halonotius terrestris]TQQ81126.1 methyltransferase domain-containing protein [Halonotius terrestris]